MDTALFEQGLTLVTVVAGTLENILGGEAILISLRIQDGGFFPTWPPVFLFHSFWTPSMHFSIYQCENDIVQHKITFKMVYRNSMCVQSVWQKTKWRKIWLTKKVCFQNLDHKHPLFNRTMLDKYCRAQKILSNSISRDIYNFFKKQDGCQNGVHVEICKI